jgi:hypothetical protein
MRSRQLGADFLRRIIDDLSRRVMHLEVLETAAGGAPGNHHLTHENGGLDEVGVAGLSGLLADEQTPLDHDHSGDPGDGGQFDAANLGSGAAPDGRVLTADGAGEAAWEATAIDPTEPALTRGIFLMSTMYGSLHYLLLMASEDGKTFNSLSSTAFYYPAGTHCQEPCIMRYGGAWWLCYTQNPQDHSETEITFGVAKSDDLVNWTFVTSVDMTGIAGVYHVWAPDWFVDPADDSVHVFVACNTTSHMVNGFKIYEVHPTNAAMTLWSAPVEVTGVGFPASLIDPFVQKVGNTYQLWYKDNLEELVEVATSNSLTSGYTVVKTGDWAGWGTKTEGSCLVELPDGKWRHYMQVYVSVPYSIAVYYSDSATADPLGAWGAKTLLGAPWQVGQGTVVLLKDLDSIQQILATYLQVGTVDHGSLRGLTDDDHTQYQLRSEKGAANGYAGLGAGGYVPHAQLGAGGGGAVKFLREDNSWQASSVLGSAWSVLTDGASNIIFGDGDVIMTETLR